LKATGKTQADSSKLDRSKLPEEKMKIQSVVPLVGLAISFALPTYAQQTDVADPQTTQSFFTSFKDYEKAFNNHDAAALTNYYMQDAVIVTPDGLISGRDTIQKWWAGNFQSHPKDFTGPLDGNVLHVIGKDGNQL
jgi:hypothetical protein